MDAARRIPCLPRRLGKPARDRQEEAQITKVVLIHDVADVEHWLAGKGRRAMMFERFGRDVRDYVAMDGSHRVAVTVDVADMDRVAQALLDTPPPEVAAELESHGVILPIQAFIEK